MEKEQMMFKEKCVFFLFILDAGEISTGVFCRVQVLSVGYRGCHRTHRTILYCARVLQNYSVGYRGRHRDIL